MRLSLIAIALVCLASSLNAQVQVNGYMRKNGTYVQGYTRSAPDTSRANNWGPSSSGNTGYSYGGMGRDSDHDGISNRYDMDDDNDGMTDNYDTNQYGGR